MLPELAYSFDYKLVQCRELILYLIIYIRNKNVSNLISFTILTNK